MQGKNLFEYAVIRIVPQVEREEFLNAGIILFCKKSGFLKAGYKMDEGRISSAFPGIDMEEIIAHLTAFTHIAEARENAGPIALLDTPSRFRWLTAKRSTIVQTSPVHPGMSDDLEKTFEKLLSELIAT